MVVCANSLQFRQRGVHLEDVTGVPRTSFAEAIAAQTVERYAYHIRRKYRDDAPSCR